MPVESRDDDGELVLRVVCEHGRTEPLTILELAAAWGIDRNTASRRLRRMDDVERVGSLWCVPLRRMPAAYVAEHLARICDKLRGRSS
jgi:hypothetical protein